MTNQFEIEEFLLNFSSFDTDGNPEEKKFDTGEFEKVLAEKYPELAEKICEYDEILEGNKKSKKKQARERVEKLEGMMTEGRSLCEKPGRNLKTTGGPMALLANAVQSATRVEVRVRSAVRIDRIFHGIPTDFDGHFNVMLRDATETVLWGRAAKQRVGDRNRVNELLPEWMRWREADSWPMPRGANTLVQKRFQRSVLVKGDSVVLIRAFPK